MPDEANVVHVKVEVEPGSPVQLQVEPAVVHLKVDVEPKLGTDDAAKKAHDLYKAEETLHEKYQGYSTEMLRLSLLGIAVLGFFFEKMATVSDLGARSRWWILFVMGVAAAFFALAAAASLAYRYYSTELLNYRLRILAGEVGPDGLDPDKSAEIDDQLFRFLILIGHVECPKNGHASMVKVVLKIANTAIGVAASFAALASFVLIIAFAIAVVGYVPKDKPAEQPPLAGAKNG